jgi:hypothetical protein
MANLGVRSLQARRCTQLPCVALELGRRLLIEPPIDPGDLGDPLLALAMLQLQNLVVWPVEMIGDVGYLLEQPLRGVAGYSPAISSSTSNASSQ